MATGITSSPSKLCTALEHDDYEVEWGFRVDMSVQISMPQAKAAGAGEYIDHAKALFILAIVGPILAALVVTNRLVFRFKITGGMGLDDWTITIATVISYV